MADSRNVLYAALGRQHLCPDYRHEPITKCGAQLFRCRLRVNGLNYTAKATAASKREAENVCAKQFIRYMQMSGMWADENPWRAKSNSNFTSSSGRTTLPYYRDSLLQKSPTLPRGSQYSGASSSSTDVMVLSPTPPSQASTFSGQRLALEQVTPQTFPENNEVTEVAWQRNASTPSTQTTGMPEMLEMSRQFSVPPPPQADMPLPPRPSVNNTVGSGQPAATSTLRSSSGNQLKFSFVPPSSVELPPASRGTRGCGQPLEIRTQPPGSQHQQQHPIPSFYFNTQPPLPSPTNLSTAGGGPSLTTSMFPTQGAPFIPAGGQPPSLLPHHPCIQQHPPPRWCHPSQRIGNDHFAATIPPPQSPVPMPAPQPAKQALVSIDRRLTDAETHCDELQRTLIAERTLWQVEKEAAAQELARQLAHSEGLQKELAATLAAWKQSETEAAARIGETPAEKVLRMELTRKQQELSLSTEYAERLRTQLHEEKTKMSENYAELASCADTAAAQKYSMELASARHQLEEAKKSMADVEKRTKEKYEQELRRQLDEMRKSKGKCEQCGQLRKKLSESKTKLAAANRRERQLLCQRLPTNRAGVNKAKSKVDTTNEEIEVGPRNKTRRVSFNLPQRDPRKRRAEEEDRASSGSPEYGPAAPFLTVSHPHQQLTEGIDGGGAAGNGPTNKATNGPNGKGLPKGGRGTIFLP